MKLNLEQIKAVTNGAVKIIEENGAYKFFRFTEEQTEAYKTRSGYEKAFATAGVKIRFKTDSKKLFLKVNTLEGGSSRSFFAFEILKDKKTIGYIKNFEETTLPEDYLSFNFPLGEFSGEFELGDGEKCIEIDFPWSVRAELLELSLDDGSVMLPVKKSNKLIAYGDSITHGYDALYPTNRYISKLSEALDADETNKAIGGEMFYPAVASKKDDFDPNYITIAYGTNDWCHCGSYEQIFNNCKEFCKGISENYPTSKIFVFSPIWRKESTEKKPTGEFRGLIDMIKNATSEFKNITVIDCYDFVPKESKYFSDLRLHPNDEGFKHYANQLIVKIKEEMNK